MIEINVDRVPVRAGWNRHTLVAGFPLTGGRLFQIFGPATLKAIWARSLFVQGTFKLVIWSVDWRNFSGKIVVVCSSVYKQVSLEWIFSLIGSRWGFLIEGVGMFPRRVWNIPNELHCFVLLQPCPIQVLTAATISSMVFIVMSFTSYSKHQEVSLPFCVLTKGNFQDAWWQQTYQVKFIVLGNVGMLRTT